uniref:(northern house mosquito) hypothetical protein n=1 Tax=Culex pipiens TaxID=7175 RepID=A0A8D8C772_CULPI
MPLGERLGSRQTSRRSGLQAIHNSLLWSVPTIAGNIPFPTWSNQCSIRDQAAILDLHRGLNRFPLLCVPKGQCRHRSGKRHGGNRVVRFSLLSDIATNA